jgi:hypothetical protein
MAPGQRPRDHRPVCGVRERTALEGWCLFLRKIHSVLILMFGAGRLK